MRRRGATSSAIATALTSRDHSDRNRTVSPLAQAADATYIDTTGLAIGDVVAQVLDLVRRRPGRAEPRCSRGRWRRWYRCESEMRAMSRLRRGFVAVQHSVHRHVQATLPVLARPSRL